MEYLFDTGWVPKPDNPAPQCEGEVKYDVAVIGGGLAGMSAGLRLAERGVRVTVLEAGLCGWGASSRNGGHLSNALGGDPRLLAVLCPRKFPQLVHFAEAAMSFTENMLQTYSIDCDYQPTGNVALASISPRGVQRAKKEVKILKSVGANVDYVDAQEFGIPSIFLGGILERGGGLVNPGKYALGLRAALLKSGAQLYEHTPALAVKTHDRGVTITVPDSQVHAERALIATNAYSKSHFFPSLYYNPPMLKILMTCDRLADRINLRHL